MPPLNPAIAQFPVLPELRRVDDGSHSIPALRILAEISTSLATENSVESLLERFLGTMVRLAGARAGAVRVLTSDGHHLRLVGALNLPDEVVAHERFIPLECGICGEAARGATINGSSDLAACQNRTSHAFFGQQCRKIVAVPLSYKGRLLGIYNLFLDGEHDVPEEVALLFQSIGEHLGMALENARLTRENLRISLTSERQLLASEIHDSLAQTLAYIKMRLTLLQDAMVAGDEKQSFHYLGDVREAMDAAYSGLRHLLSNFRNRMDPRGLMPALQDMAAGFPDKAGIRLDYINNASDINLTPDQEVQVFHIVQEALSNISKHSHATLARLIIDALDEEYVVSIEDNGVGLPRREENQEEGMHFGLNIMRERAQRLSGHICVQPGIDGCGTRIVLAFPATLCRQEKPA